MHVCVYIYIHIDVHMYMYIRYIHSIYLVYINIYRMYIYIHADTGLCPYIHTHTFVNSMRSQLRRPGQRLPQRRGHRGLDRARLSQSLTCVIVKAFYTCVCTYKSDSFLSDLVINCQNGDPEQI